MKYPNDIDEYAKRLPLSADELREEKLPEQFVQRLIRLRGLYTYWLDNPLKMTAELVEYDRKMFSAGRSQAYEDIKLVKTLIGDVQASTKDFWRWRINSMIMESYKAAREDGDWKALASMQKNLILNNKTDKDDPIDLKLDQIIPQVFEMTDDISIVIPQAQKTPREKIEKLLKKYGKRDSVVAEAEEIESPLPASPGGGGER